MESAGSILTVGTYGIHFIAATKHVKHGSGDRSNEKMLSKTFQYMTLSRRGYVTFLVPIIHGAANAGARDTQQALLSFGICADGRCIPDIPRRYDRGMRGVMTTTRMRTLHAPCHRQFS